MFSEDDLTEIWADEQCQRISHHKVVFTGEPSPPYGVLCTQADDKGPSKISQWMSTRCSGINYQVHTAGTILLYL